MTDWTATKARDVLETVRLGYVARCPLTGEPALGWDRSSDDAIVARLQKANDGKDVLAVMDDAIRSTAIFASKLPLYH